MKCPGFWKYFLSFSPALICGGIATIYWYISSTGAHVRLRSGMELTPKSSDNIAWVFVFAGVVFTLMSLAFSAFSDWRAWDDRRALRKSLGSD